ncbi:hypothetical protein [Stenotrophomonas sp. B1-1]|uniref:hypothetical protein n=1 Tax=Stenotrophomonas sp. B1-1 TaxID=2710648 RepID=UPI0013DA55AA|nr:hypothetical protein [Stenotrophomonas sp. B1-1]
MNIKHTPRSAIVAICMLLEGCSFGTPSCADKVAIEVLEEAIKNEVGKYADRNNLDALDSFRTLGDTYSLSHIRILEHDREADSFKCDARITYQLNGRERAVDFLYRVDTDQSDGGVVVEYELKMLKPIYHFFAAG